MELDRLQELLFPEHELSIEQRKEIKYLYDTMLSPYEGHPVFEIHLVNKTICIAKVKPLDTVTFHNWKEEIRKNDLIKNPNCIYITSLNINNLKRKFKAFSEYEYIQEDGSLVVNKNRNINLYNTSQ